MPRAHAQRHALGAKDDGVALDELGDFPGEQQVSPLRRCWGHGGDDAQLVLCDVFGIAGLQQQAAAHALEVKPVHAVRRAFSQRHFKHTQVLFGGEQGARIGVHAGRNDDFDKLLVAADALSAGQVERAVKRHDAAEG